MKKSTCKLKIFDPESGETSTREVESVALTLQAGARRFSCHLHISARGNGQLTLTHEGSGMAALHFLQMHSQLDHADNVTRARDEWALLVRQHGAPRVAQVIDNMEAKAGQGTPSVVHRSPRVIVSVIA